MTTCRTDAVSTDVMMMVVMRVMVGVVVMPIMMVIMAMMRSMRAGKSQAVATQPIGDARQ